MKMTDDQCAEIRGQLCEMDNAARRKRAERLRRKEAGEVRIEAWIDADVRNRLVAGCHRSGITLARGIEMMVNDKWPASHPWAQFDWRAK